ncbi:MAG: DUF3458 domain-containing protein, partial [Caldimonas sp.]
HDGQAVTCDDFAQAIADANPASDLARLLPQFRRWYSQSGTPVVSARGRYDAPSRTFTLGIEQSATGVAGQAAKEPFVIPLRMGLVGREGQQIAMRLEDEPADAAATDRVLVIDEAKSFFTFVDVDEPPVLSLLRGFSAPVRLVDGQSDADLVVLLRHDSDAFNRWEAGQRLALGRLLERVRSPEPPTALDAAFVDAMRALLVDPDLDPSFKALALTLPGESYIADQLDVVDPQRIHLMRTAMTRELAQSLRATWEETYESHQVGGGYSPDAVSAGRRSLANLALAMLCLDAEDRGDATWTGRAYQRFKDAGNMTDRQGALTALIGAGSALAQPALERFHALFRGDALVIDKWFMLQAVAPERGQEVLSRVRALLAHPDFSLSNPNRARSLIGSFCNGNPAAFHRRDGSGYAFWADRVLELDAVNPQLASRIARALDRWSRLAEPYRSAAREALARVAAQAKLSNDTGEIVSRALAS